MKQFVKLPGGALLDVMNIAYVLRIDIGKFAVIPKATTSPNVPVLETAEYEALVAFLAEDGQLAVLEVAKDPVLAKA